MFIEDMFRLQDFVAETNAALFGRAALKLEEVATAVEIHKAKGRLLKRIVFTRLWCNCCDALPLFDAMSTISDTLFIRV